MQTKPRNILRSKPFKVFILLVYFYSFAQLDANDANVEIEFVQLDTIASLEKIQIEINQPMTILIRMFGKNKRNDQTETTPSN